MQTYTITIEDVLCYAQQLLDYVEQQLPIQQDNKTKEILSKLQTLLKSDAIPRFINGLKHNKVNLKAGRDIQKIDNAIEELRILQLNLPQPNEKLSIGLAKQDKDRQFTVLMLVLGLLGFEWVIE